VESNNGDAKKPKKQIGLHAPKLSSSINTNRRNRELKGISLMI